jgi:tetratricopeptide (TPR) repeat protein
MGDAINMAARLMCSPKCNGIILCDEKTYTLCENEFSFLNLGLLKVKGKAHPINIYQPKEAKEKTVQIANTTDSNVFLGRETERALISKLLDTHTTVNGPRIMIMEAEGGMGLSTMARWTEKVVKDQQLCLASGRNSSQTEKNTRYYIWQEIVRDLVAAVEAMPINEVRVKTAAEPRIPLFLMTPKEEKSGTSRGTSGSGHAVGGKSVHGGHQKSSAAGGTKSMMNNGQQSSRRPKGRLGDSMANKSKSNEKGHKLSAIPASMNGSMASSSLASSKKKAAASRQRQKPPGSADEAAPPFHAHSQDFAGSRGNNAENGPAMKKWLAFEEQMKTALTKSGESPNQAAIMNLVYPFDFQQTEVYTKLQGKFRINELTDLIRRMINEIGEWKPVVITIHDSQWIDQLGWELLWELAMSCPKLMICLFSRLVHLIFYNLRPEKYHESVETKMQYQKFKRHPQSEFLNLEGLVTEDVEKLISLNWASSVIEIKSVSQNILSNIQKRTAGNPLYIKSALVALKESGKFSVTEYGELTLNSGEFDFEKSISLVDNLQSVITSQLDRLDSNFQLFLKVASVLGQPFLIEDALNLLHDTPMFSDLADKVESDPETINAFIKAMDKYEYLERIENIDAEQFQFKSSLVKECIYNMMLQNQRQLLHLNVATYYEQIIDSQNQHRLFLALYEHYSKADEIHTMKKLTYLQIMSHIYFERNSIGEAIKHYKMLLLAVEKHPKHIKITFDDVAKASWHRELGESYFMRGDALKAEKHLLESLRINSFKFPNTWWSLRVKTAKEWKNRGKWPILLAGDADLTSGQSQVPDLASANLDSNSGSHDSLAYGDMMEMRSNDITDIITDEMQFDPMAVVLADMIKDKEYAKLHNIRRAMSCLGQMYLNTGRYKDCVYAINCATNISELFPRDAFYAKLMALCGIISWTEGAKKRDTLRYLESASKHDQRFDLVQSVSIVLKSAQAFFFMGKWGSAIRRLGLLPALEMMSGDFQLRLDALRMRSVIIHLCGARPQSLKAAKALFYIATQEDNWEGQLWGCQMILANYLNIMKANNELPEYAARLKGIWERKPAKLKYDPTLNLNYLALMTRVKLRTEIDSFSVDAFFKKFHSIILELQRPSPKKYSEDSFSARGGECNSAGGPLECLSMIGVLHCAVSILAMWDAKLIKQSHWKYLQKINKDLKVWLTTGNIMQNMTITESMHQLFEGAVLHITAHTSAAIKLWKKGLSGRRVSDLMYVRGLLHLLVACYTDSANNSNHNAHEAQKLFSRIGATVEFDRARAYRKDRKDRSRSEMSSQQTGGEMDENFGESIFDHGGNSFESELESESN